MQTIDQIQLTAKRADIFKVPTSQLYLIDGLNIRTDYGDLQELAESIKENGVKVPLRGYKKVIDGKEVYVVTDGHRRTKASQILLEQGIEILVPFITEAKGYSDEQRLIDMFIMNEGKALNPLEQAEGVRRLIAYGYSEKEIAGKLAKSEGYIRKLNSLNSAPKKLINLIERGVISATLAINAIAEGNVQDILDKSEPTKVIASDDTAEMNQANDGTEIKDPQPSGGEKKITKKDLQVNSVKEFKKFARNQDEELLSEDVVYIFQFAKKLANNELTGEEIKEFFK
jgi:ParB/RepB/Spo0J family partition protein